MRDSSERSETLRLHGRLQNRIKQRGLRRIVLAFLNSRRGILETFRNEAAFRQEVWLLLIFTPLALWLGETWLERVLLIAAMLLVLIVELLNSGLESLSDRIGLDYHELSGRAKDQGSAAVMLSLGVALMIWLAVIFS